MIFGNSEILGLSHCQPLLILGFGIGKNGWNPAIWDHRIANTRCVQVCFCVWLSSLTQNFFYVVYYNLAFILSQ